MITLSLESKKLLLTIARNTIRDYFHHSNNTREYLKNLSNHIKNEIYNELSMKCGAFVTLHKHGDLRGCIGTFRMDMKLYDVVSDMAIQSAFHDPRFSPLKESELNDIEIEISVLTPMERLHSVEDIEVGLDGLYVKKGFNSGVLLPQVATEHGWDKYQFLSYTCLKAGLPNDIWKKEHIELYRFRAIVFSESNLG
ncbi:MAG: AmmeMemoRadiSam system protein A [Calditerrivibrio sp.]|nr:AmmeMemoRadiSam system protein A [Calditerrivibrio sp.]